jgi:hypothetical protein
MSRPVGRHARVPDWLRPLSWWVGRRFRWWHHALRSATAKPHPRPIFVLGNQKSGTSAIAGLLARRCGLSVSLDMLQETYFPTFHRVPGGDLSFERYRRINRWEFSHEVVKEPNLTLLYPWLREAYPDSSMVFVVRDPRDNIRSLLNRLSIPGDLERLEERHKGEMNAGWELVLDGRWLGIEGEHFVDQLAARWVYCAQVYRDHAAVMHLSRYEDFEADKLGELDRLAGLLGLEMVHDVRDDLHRSFQPPGDRGVGWRDFFGETNLARIETICGEAMQTLGYEPSSG